VDLRKRCATRWPGLARPGARTTLFSFRPARRTRSFGCRHRAACRRL
jgi:hypothetical protein